MEEPHKNMQKGLGINATFGQLVGAIMVFVILFVLPIGGYEALKGRYSEQGGKNVYTSENLQKKQNNSSGDESGTGKVAGISTSKAQDTVAGTTDVLDFVTQSQVLMIGGGIVLLAVSFVLSGSLVYDFWKK